MAKSFNTTRINDLIVTAFASHDAYAATVAKLRVAFEGADRATVSLSVKHIAAERYSACLNENGNWLDKDCAAKRHANRLIAAILNVKAADTDSLQVPEDIQTLAAKLVKLCGAYEKSAKLLATAISNAKAA